MDIYILVKVIGYAELVVFYPICLIILNMFWSAKIVKEVVALYL